MRTPEKHRFEQTVVSEPIDGAVAGDVREAQLPCEVEAGGFEATETIDHDLPAAADHDGSAVVVRS